MKTRNMVVQVAVLAAALGGAALATTPASASTSTTPAPAACSQKSVETVHDQGATGWMRYNTCSRLAWGKMHATGNKYYWKVWIWNENTHKQASAYDFGGTVLTKSVNDAGTKSHVCIRPFSKTTGAWAGNQHCTGYY